MKSISLHYTYCLEKIFLWSIYYTFYLAKLGPLLKSGEIVINTSYNYESQALNVFIRFNEEKYIDYIILVDNQIHKFLNSNEYKIFKIHEELKNNL